MSDFDDLLERLVLDPDFKAALAADPDGVLRGYRLDADQRRVLLTQVSTETGTGLKVEERISKAGMAGLLSAFSEGAGGFSQHTMQGVHTVAPAAHGPTISAGAIQHAFDSGAPAVDTAPTGPPGQSMAGAFAAIQNAMEHIHQAQATGLGGPVAGGFGQGSQHGLAAALQNAMDHINQTQAATGGGAAAGGVPGGFGSQHGLAAALQNAIDHINQTQAATGGGAAAGGVPGGFGSQHGLAAALQNAIDHINQTQAGAAGGSPGGATGPDAAWNMAAGGFQQPGSGGPQPPHVNWDVQQPRGGGTGPAAMGAEVTPGAHAASIDQSKGSGPTKMDGTFKGTGETKGHLGTIDPGGSSSQHYYDRHGRPITAQQAADLQARHEPVYHHVDAKGTPISDDVFNAHYPHLAQYQAATQQGTHYYDDHGRPLTPEMAAQYEAQHHHPPIYHHVDAKGQPISDDVFNAHYPHLDHYKTAYAQGTRFYDDHGRPLTPEQAAQYEAQHHHAPAEHVDAKGQPMTNEQWAKYQGTHSPKGPDVPGPSGAAGHSAGPAPSVASAPGVVPTHSGAPPQGGATQSGATQSGPPTPGGAPGPGAASGSTGVARPAGIEQQQAR